MQSRTFEKPQNLNAAIGCFCLENGAIGQLLELLQCLIQIYLAVQLIQ